MSHVADILLCTAIGDAAEQLSGWLVEQYGPPNTLKRLDHIATGGKAMQCDVFGVAVNYCDIDGLVRKFRTIPWEFPESAQLMVKDESDDVFTIYGIEE